MGRTGTLICSYAMKNYKIPAKVMIAWNRICRPGSILGPQQHFLCQKEAALMAMSSIITGAVVEAEVTAGMKVII